MEGEKVLKNRDFGKGFGIESPQTPHYPTPNPHTPDKHYPRHTKSNGNRYIKALIGLAAFFAVLFVLCSIFETNEQATQLIVGNVTGMIVGFIYCSYLEGCD